MFKKIARVADKLIEHTSRLALFGSGAMMLVMAFAVTYGVVMRYFFDRPSHIVYELSMILMVASFVFAVGYVQRTRQHIRVDFVFMRLPQTGQDLIFNLLMPVVAFFFAAMLTWRGCAAFMYSFEIAETSRSIWGEPIWPTKLLIPIGYGLLSLVTFSEICYGVYKLKNKMRNPGQ